MWLVATVLHSADIRTFPLKSPQWHKSLQLILDDLKVKNCKYYKLIFLPQIFIRFFNRQWAYHPRYSVFSLCFRTTKVLGKEINLENSSFIFKCLQFSDVRLISSNDRFLDQSVQKWIGKYIVSDFNSGWSCNGISLLWMTWKNPLHIGHSISCSFWL